MLVSDLNFIQNFSIDLPKDGTDKRKNCKNVVKPHLGGDLLLVYWWVKETAQVAVPTGMDGSGKVHLDVRVAVG